MDKDQHGNKLWKEFLGTAVHELTANTVFQSLDKDQQGKQLWKEFLGTAVHELTANTVFQSLDKDQQGKQLWKEFVHNAISGTALSAPEFVSEIREHIDDVVREAFLADKGLATDGFTAAAPASRDPVWVKTWKDDFATFRKELVLHFSAASVTVIDTFAHELASDVLTLGNATLLRDALIREIPLPEPPAPPVP
jgi:hypothetical protein